MKIELFFNLDFESLIFCDKFAAKLKTENFHKPLKMLFSKKLRFDQLAPWVG